MTDLDNLKDEGSCMIEAGPLRQQ